ncbi:MAG: hypothetical protein HY314_14165 [Acidobacteria bacterium]|nr:hypothetical protein [Acidobacteriota bacterium]
MKKIFACLAMVGALLTVVALTANIPNVAFILTIFFGGPLIAQIGIGLGVFLAGLVLGVDLTPSLILGL